MGGGRYGSAWNVRKMKKTDNPPWRPLPCLPARSRHIRRRLAVKFFRQGRLFVLLLPGRRVCKGGGRNRLPRPKPDWPKNRSKRLSSGSAGFEKFF